MPCTDKGGDAKNVASPGNRDEVRRLFDQDFEEIRSRCLRERKLFEDPTFPADQGSFYADYDPMKPRVHLVWLRPGEISESPVLLADGASRFDLMQGNLGNCWFIGSVSGFADFRMNCKDKTCEQVFSKVVPEDQGFGDNYAGVFRFRFWQFGEWVEVVVDDRLPTKNGYLCCLSSSDKNEYWSALLEKAYAKLYGSYEALVAGEGSEALVDLTGAYSCVFLLNKEQDIFNTILKAYKEKALIGCSTKQELEAPNGIIDNHFYTITRVANVQYNFLGETGQARMLRLRNPWGNAAEWEGPGKDDSLEWNFIPKEVKESMELNVEDDGEFWIPYKFFIEKYASVEICRLSSEVEKNMKVLTLHGSWKKGAGNDPELLKNAHHVIKTTHEQKHTSVHIYLMEKGRRKMRREFQDLSLYICKLPKGGNEISTVKIKVDSQDVVASATYYGREVQITVKLAPLEKYAVVPVREKTEPKCDYLLRIVHDHPINCF